MEFANENTEKVKSKGDWRHILDLIVVVRRDLLVTALLDGWTRFFRRGAWILLGCVVLAGLSVGFQCRFGGVTPGGVKPQLTALVCVLLTRLMPISGLVFAGVGGLLLDATSPGIPLGFSWIGLTLASHYFGAGDWFGGRPFRGVDFVVSCGLCSAVVVVFGYLGGTLSGGLCLSLAGGVWSILVACFSGVVLGGCVVCGRHVSGRISEKVRTWRRGYER